MINFNKVMSRACIDNFYVKTQNCCKNRESLSMNKKVDTFDILSTPDDIFKDEYSFLDIDYIIKDVLWLHSRGSRCFVGSNRFEGYGKKYEDAKRVCTRLLVYAEELAEKTYDIRQPKDEFGKLMSFHQYRVNIEGFLFNIQGRIEEVIEEMNLSNSEINQALSLGDELIDDFMKVMKEHSEKLNCQNRGIYQNGAEIFSEIKGSLLQSKDSMYHLNELRTCMFGV